MYAFLADIHLGTKLKHMDYLKALDQFISIIKKHKEECHCIFVCGDVFDHILSVNDRDFASLFLLNLACNNCGRNGKLHVPVHFIHGTYSHDNDQYQSYLRLLSEINGTELFYTKNVCNSQLVNGKSVLYLPQVYGDIDFGDILNEDKHYDIIIGHGPISSVNKSPCKSASREIVHSVETLGKISNVCVFGHYHGYTDFGNNVYYAGSFLRWQYGEHEEKVFIICNDNFEVETYHNDTALEYKTIEVDNPEQLRELISTNIDTPHRFIIKPKLEDIKTYHSIMNINKNANISYQVLNIDAEENKPIITPEVQHEDNSVGPVESLIKFINDKYNVDASKEIEAYVNKISKE